MVDVFVLVMVGISVCSIILVWFRWEFRVSLIRVNITLGKFNKCESFGKLALKFFITKLKAKLTYDHLYILYSNSTYIMIFGPILY